MDSHAVFKNLYEALKIYSSYAFYHTDIDECTEVEGICHHQCINVWGGYQCTCRAGYSLAADNRLNVLFSLMFQHWKCECMYCIDYSYIARHLSDFWSSFIRTCEDINECEEARGRGRLCIGSCVNTPGSFSCSCPDGYTLAADGRTCKGNLFDVYLVRL